MVIGENSYLQDSSYLMIEIDKIAVKGKSAAETIFTCFEPETKFAEDFMDKHLNFLEKYRSQQWDSASLLVDELISSSNGLELYYEHMRTRIDEYKIDPPSSDWGGVYVAQNK